MAKINLYCLIDGGAIVAGPYRLPKNFVTATGERVSGLRNYGRRKLAQDFGFYRARFATLEAFQDHGDPIIDDVDYWVDYPAVDMTIEEAKASLVAEMYSMAKNKIDNWEDERADAEKINFYHLRLELEDYDQATVATIGPIMQNFIWEYSLLATDPEKIAAADALRSEYFSLTKRIYTRVGKRVRARRKHEAEIALLADLTACRAYDIGAYWDVA